MTTTTAAATTATVSKEFDDLLALMDTNDAEKARLILFHLLSAFTPTPLHLAVRDVSSMEPLLRLFLAKDLRGADFAEFIRGNVVVGTVDLDDRILVNDEEATHSDLLFKKACYVPEYILLFPPSQRVTVRGRPLVVVETNLDTRTITVSKHCFYLRVIDTRDLEIALRNGESTAAAAAAARQAIDTLIQQKKELLAGGEDVENPFERPLLEAVKRSKGPQVIGTVLEYLLDSQKVMAFMRGRRQVAAQDVQDSFALIRGSGLFGKGGSFQRVAFEKLEQKLEAFAHTVNHTGATSCA